MNNTVLFLIFFLAMSLQMFITIFQAKDYKRNLNKFAGKGIVGVGHTKGVLRPGQIVMLLYDQNDDRIKSSLIMRGRTVFARFKEDPTFDGMTLDEIRKIAIEEDQKFFKRHRKKHPYDPEEITKKKHSLIQAVEAIDRRIKQDKIRVQRIDRMTAAEELAQKVDPSAFNS